MKSHGPGLRIIQKNEISLNRASQQHRASFTGAQPLTRLYKSRVAVRIRFGDLDPRRPPHFFGPGNPTSPDHDFMVYLWGYQNADEIFGE